MHTSSDPRLLNRDSHLPDARSSFFFRLFYFFLNNIKSCQRLQQREKDGESSMDSERGEEKPQTTIMACRRYSIT